MGCLSSKMSFGWCRRTADTDDSVNKEIDCGQPISVLSDQSVFDQADGQHVFVHDDEHRVHTGGAPSQTDTNSRPQILLTSSQSSSAEKERQPLLAVQQGHLNDALRIIQEHPQNCGRSSEEFVNYASIEGLEIAQLNYTDDYQQFPGMRRGRQENVTTISRRGVVGDLSTLVLNEAIKRTNFIPFLPRVFPHCTEEQKKYFLTQLMKQRRWQDVDVMLQRGMVQNELHSFVFKEASKEANDFDFCIYILRNSSESQLDSVIKQLAQRRLWRSTGEILLRRAASNDNIRFAVSEALEQAAEPDLHQHILPNCTETELAFVLNKLVKRSLWSFVGRVLRSRLGNDNDNHFAIWEASLRATENDLLAYILPQCTVEKLLLIGRLLVSRDLWKAVSEVIKRGVSVDFLRFVIQEASKRADDRTFLDNFYPYCTSDNLLTHAVKSLVSTNRLTFIQRIMGDVVSSALLKLAMSQKRSDVIDEQAALSLLSSCYIDAWHATELSSLLKQERATHVSELTKGLGWDMALCEVFFTAVTDSVRFSLHSDSKQNWQQSVDAQDYVFWIFGRILVCIRDNNSPLKNKDVIRIVKRVKKETKICFGKTPGEASHPLNLLFFLEKLNLYHTSRVTEHSDNMFLIFLAVLPLCPELQGAALKVMLCYKRWDVISLACLTHVWEQDRRKLFQTAVKQRQWRVVKQWADHTLHDDQRLWALEEAFREKQWEVYLLLADHGLTEIELMRVHGRLARYADWDVVLQMFKRGGDMEEARVLLGVKAKEKKTAPHLKIEWTRRYYKLLILQEEFDTKSASSFKKALSEQDWYTVLHSTFLSTVDEYFHLALAKAVRSKAWRVVIQLVRQGMKTTKRDSLFSKMKRRLQWDVCRVLLEQRVSVELCLNALPELMKAHQWSLAARVMEYDVEDALRRQVMQLALERREGSLVWHCISTMQDTLSVKEREDLFQRGFSSDLWQVIKPLIEEKDKTGIGHRDTALLEAIDQHQWDVVDHCQRYHADINMKDEHDETPLHRAARKKDWEAVDALVIRDGDPNLLDNEGYSVLNRVIIAEQWSTVKLLVEYQADIHLLAKVPESYSRVCHYFTPLQLLIDARQGEIIELTLIWLPDQWKGVNEVGETTLHAACMSGCWSAMYYLLARKVDPLAVTHTGQSALVYAVLNKDCPQRMVAECIRLGFGTGQTALTGDENAVSFLLKVVKYSIQSWIHNVRSPLVVGMLLDLPQVVCMLYESGSCSNRELFKLYKNLASIWSYRELILLTKETPTGFLLIGCWRLLRVVRKFLPFLKEVSTTPRRLESTCRLVITRCLDVRGKLHRDVQNLNLKESMKDYVLFSDLTDPDFGKHLLSSKGN